MNVLTPFLFPFAVIYDLATRVRNNLYDRGMKPSATFEVPTVGVGNLAVGGTGKTPMIEYLIRMLSDDYHIATLSRGYRRATKGVRIAGPGDSARTIGDEPMQFYQKFGDNVVVAVGEERVFAVPHILDHQPAVDLILLDDVFQHRRIQPAFQILLTDYRRPFVDDFLLPAGRLRESRRGAKRADVVVVTKCPASLEEEEMQGLARRIKRYTDAPVFFSGLRYGTLKAVSHEGAEVPDNVVLVSGIANPAPLEDFARKNYHLVKHMRFSDHHAYTRADVERICAIASKEGAAVVTTEKDFTKLGGAAFRSRSVPLFVIPIEMTFVKYGEEFNEIVRNAIKRHAA